MPELLRQSQADEKAGRIEEAAQARREAIRLLTADPERADQWFQLALFYGRVDRPELRAEALVESLRYLPPSDSGHWKRVESLLRLYREELNRPGVAINLLERLTEHTEPSQGDVEIWAEFAWTLLAMGDATRACPIFDILSRRGGGKGQGKRVNIGRDWCHNQPAHQLDFNRNIETAAIIGQFRSRLSEKKWEAAIGRITDLLSRFPDCLLDWPGYEGVGPRRAASELLAAMPIEARHWYQNALEVERAKAIREGHSEEIERFGYLYPWPATQPALLVAAGDALSREDRLARASAFYRLAADWASTPDERRGALVKAARVAALVGEPVPPNLPLDAEITVAGQPTALKNAVVAWQKEPRCAPSQPADATLRSSSLRSTSGITIVPLSRMKHDRLRLQQKPLLFHNWEVGWQSGRRDKNPGMTAAFTPCVLSGDRSQVFLNTTEMVYAIDPVAEKLLWARTLTELFPARNPPPPLRGDHQIGLTLSPKQTFVAVSTDTAFFHFTWAARGSDTARSAIFAADRRTGELRWSTQTLPELNGLRFASSPAYGDGTVVAAVWEPRSIPVIYLIGLDAVTGELLWKTHLFSGTLFPSLRDLTEVDTPLGSPPPTIDRGRVYFTASMGVLACVDLLDGQVLWLDKYPRVFEYGPAKWAGQFFLNRPVRPILVRGDVILAAPQDAQGVLAFDATNGMLLRQYGSYGFRGMIGATNSHVFVQQDGAIVSLRMSDLGIAWQTELPTTTIIGSPSLSPRGIICATHEGMFVVSPTDGRIIEHLPRFADEPAGNPLDLQDRIVAVASSAVHVLAADSNQGQNWSTPRAPESVSVTSNVTVPSGLARWILPAPDRNDFFLSPAAPDLMVIRNWETFELRQTGPAPSLLWEYPGEAWPESIQFDGRIAALEYPEGRLVGIEVKSGKPRFDLHDPRMAANRGEGGAIVAGDLIIWFKGRRLVAVNSADGRSRWAKDLPNETLLGISPRPQGLGVFLQGDGGFASLLERTTGTEIRRVQISNDKAGLRCVSPDAPNTIVVSPLVVAKGNQLAWVDFAAGTVRWSDTRLAPREKLGNVELHGDVAFAFAGASGCVGMFTLPDLKPLKFHPAQVTDISNGVQYYVNGPRVIAYDLATGAPLWQSGHLGGNTVLLSVAGKHLLSVQEISRRGESASLFKVTAIRRDDGTIAETVAGLAAERNKMKSFGGSLYLADACYLYRFSEPTGEQAGTRPKTAPLAQAHADPDAVAALKLARDCGGRLAEPPPASTFAPTIDAQLDDWNGAQWIQLRSPDDWLPDHVRLSSDHPRRVRDDADLSAKFALSQDAKHVYVAVCVQDDVHDAAPGRPLWCSDSVRLAWQGVGESSGPGDAGAANVTLRSGASLRGTSRALTLTGALVDGVPCVESGGTQEPVPVLSDVAAWPEGLVASLADKDVPWLRRRQVRAAHIPGVQFMAARDEVAAQTTYEWSISVDLLPGGRAGRSSLLFDLIVNEADADGHKGGLAFASSQWQMQGGTGWARWPIARSSKP